MKHVMREATGRIAGSVVLVVAFAASAAMAGSWIAADFGGRKPKYPAGSLYFRTNQYPTSPILFRTVIDVPTSVDWATVRFRGSGHLYVYLNGQPVGHVVAGNGQETTMPLDVELTDHLKHGRNVLAVSTGQDGFAAEGVMVMKGGARVAVRSGTHWRAQKLAPLTILELEPSMKATFDASSWFKVRSKEDGGLNTSMEELQQAAQSAEAERLKAWDVHAHWRLEMLASQGWAVVDWESHGFGGAGRLPEWLVRQASRPVLSDTPGALHKQAEALARWSVLNDHAINLAQQARGLAALNGDDRLIDTYGRVGALIRSAASAMAEHCRAGRFDQAIAAATEAEQAIARLRAKHVINPLNHGLDNKFGWFDSTRLLDSRPEHWKLALADGRVVLASPLSPGCMVRASEGKLTLRGYDELRPIKVFKKPALTGPVSLWAPIGGKIAARKPDKSGLVYDRAKHGRLEENWVLLATDMTRGGDLPVQIVFLDEPHQIRYRRKRGDTVSVEIRFGRPEARALMVRPLKEWRGLLWMGPGIAAESLDMGVVGPYVAACRFWSRALLAYPINYSESFVRPADRPWTLLVADVYGYRFLKDAWDTKPQRLALLPPLASYGLLTNYPGLRVISNSKTVGSLGNWGDLVAVEDADTIIYELPIARIKRFGGFTSFCFSPVDIGFLGSKQEIETVRLTGANSYRPQHNETDQRAMQTAHWCIEAGIQNMFNTDEKWLPDVVAHYATLARQCRDLPRDLIAYDLLNEPETRDPRAYGALVKKITAAIRAEDEEHLIYVETMPRWGPGAKPFPQGAFETLEPTGDRRTVYSFHDYEFRLGRIESRGKAGDAAPGKARWPNSDADLRSVYDRWIPALRFSIQHRTPIHLGEFGGFEQVKGQDVFANRCAYTMMMDFLKLFDRFGWHWHYYTNRDTTRVRHDGSLEDSTVQDAHRAYFKRRTFNHNLPDE
jgi:hypothetical protein